MQIIKNFKKSFFAFKLEALSRVAKQKSQSIDNGDFIKFGRMRFLNKSEAYEKILKSDENINQKNAKWIQWVKEAEDVAHNLAETKMKYYDDIFDKRAKMKNDFLNLKLGISTEKQEKLDLDLNDDRQKNKISKNMHQSYAQNFCNLIVCDNHYLLYENKLGYIEGYVQFGNLFKQPNQNIFITELATKPELGIAGALINTLKGKYKSIKLSPADENARNFYIKMGFKKDNMNNNFMTWEKSNKKLK